MPDQLMTVKEVATYLRVNERTVLKLAAEGALPGARVGNQWRFQPGAIGSWLEDQRLGLATPRSVSAAHPPPGRALLSLEECFEPGQIVPELAATSRDGVVGELVDFAHGRGLVRDPARFAAAIREREAMMSSATPHGFAFLHTLRRMPELVRRPFMVMGRSRAGVAYGAPDGKPTRIFFLLGLKFEGLHLGWMSKLSWMLTRPEDVQAVLDAPDPASVYDLLRRAESDLHLPAEQIPTPDGPRGLGIR
ncbi:MAG: PTS sugar transporter subunit IIA [Candidatus Eisenbacteria bacterium]|nr:PTS sugar transporter subunit IIA [Candidatus Eisenbacteria bacterium]